jgi:hypothetical protein
MVEMEKTRCRLGAPQTATQKAERGYHVLFRTRKTILAATEFASF